MKKRIFPQLDGLRGLAAVMVVIRHYWPGALPGDVALSRLAVDTFFVLSGYLITRTLLRAREKTPDAPGAVLKRFHRRRVQRIFPVYYVSLALAALIPSQRSIGLLWHAAFLSNFYFILQRRFVGAYGHLWAIAVEQHFYLLWPLIVLWVPRRRMPAAAWGMIAIGLLTHWIAGVAKWSDLAIDISTPAAFGSLGAGALLSTWLETREETPERFGMWISAIGLSGMILCGVDLITGRWFHLLFTELSRSLMLAWLVAQAVWGIPGWIGMFLESTPARLLGRWSYAIYLSHNFFFAMFKARPHQVWPLSIYNSQAALALAATMVWSIACYQFLEKPFLQ